MIEVLKNKFNLLLNDEKFKEILHGSFYSFLAKIISSLLGIVTSIIVARYYGAETIGLVALIITILSISGLFSSMGMTTSLLRLVPEYTEKYSKEIAILLYKKVLSIILISSISVAVVLYISSDIIANKIFHKPDLLLFISSLSIVLVFDTIKSVNMTMIRSLKKIKSFVILELSPKVISLFLILLLTFLFYDKYNPIYIALTVPVFMFLLTTGYIFIYVLPLYTVKKTNNHLPSNLEMIKLSFPMFLTAGLSLIITQTDIVMIGMLRDTKEVGIYSIALSLAMLTNFVLNSVNMMSAPKFSELYHAGKMDELQYVVQKSSKLMFLATLPIVLVLILFGKFILGIYSDAFRLGYIALLFLTLGQFVNAASGSVGYLLNMTGYQKEFRNIILIAAIINVVLNFILLPIYGINGAAFASLCSVVFWNVSSTLYIKQKFGFIVAYIPSFMKIRR